MSLYGLTIGLSLLILSHGFSKNNGIIPKKLEDIFIIFLLLSLLVGARTYHVAGEWTYYSQHPDQIINLKAGGLGIYGALLAAFLYTYIFSVISKIPFLKITDIFAPWIPLAQALGRIGNYLNTEGFGTPTTSGLGQFVPPPFRPDQYLNFTHFHPVWLYEAILSLVLFICMRKIGRHKTAAYLVGYGLIRFITEFFRFDTWTVNQIKVAQLISLGFILVGTVLLNTHVSQKNKSNIRPDQSHPVGN